MLAECAREQCQLFCDLMTGYWWVIVGVFLSYKISSKLWWKKQELLPEHSNGWQQKLVLDQPASWQQKPVNERPLARQQKQPQKQQQQGHSPPKGAGKWRKKLLILFVFAGVTMSIWLFWHFNRKHISRREETLANMCDERARMLQDQFNVSMNHVHALAILVSTFHHGKYPSAIDQVTCTLNTLMFMQSDFSFIIGTTLLIYTPSSLYPSQQ